MCCPIRPHHCIANASDAAMRSSAAGIGAPSADQSSQSRPGIALFQGSSAALAALAVLVRV
jgi:hypothetical protein